MLGLYAAVAILLASCWVVGHALLQLLRSRIEPGLAPAFGLALILAVAYPAILAPGNDLTAAVVIGLMVVAALLVLGGRPPAPAAADLWLSLVIAVAIAIPFAASGRYGVLGAATTDDLGLHLAVVDALRHGTDVTTLDPSFGGYPLGAHALAGALAGLPGLSGLSALTAVTAVSPFIAAVAVRASLAGELGTTRAALCGGLTALPYLAAAWYGTGQFKELIVAALALAFALGLRSLQRQGAVSWRDLLAMVVLAAGAISAFGLSALAWPIVITAPWLGFQLLRRRGRPRQRLGRRALVVAMASALIGAALLAPYLGDQLRFVGEAAKGEKAKTYGGFLGARDLTGQEALGMWPGDDSRRDPGSGGRVLADVGALAALGIAIAGAAWWFRRRDPIPPLAALGATVVSLVTAARYGPYVTAKTLVVLAPLLSLIVFAPLLAWSQAASRLWRRVAAGAGVAVLGGLAAWSSILVLRGSPVGPLDRADELSTLRRTVGDRPLLFLVNDDYAPWELRGARISAAIGYGVHPAIPLELQPGLALGSGFRPDFDAVESDSLDDFDYAITSRSRFASDPPPNWHLVRRTDSFSLFRREGPTPLRLPPPEEGFGPGATIDCRTPQGVSLTRRRGSADVRPAPLTGRPYDWRTDERPPAFGVFGYALLPPDSTLSQELALPRGRWELSLQYQSARPLNVEAAGRRFGLPADLSPLGNSWRVGVVGAPGGPLRVGVSQDEGGPLSVATKSAIGTVAAVRPGTRSRLVPLRAVCGRFVDWYRPTGR